MNENLLKDPEVLKIAMKVKPQVEPKIAEMMAERLPAPVSEVPTTVEVVARGESFTHRVTTAEGDGFEPASRMSDHELILKFRENASHVLSHDAVDALEDRIIHLELCEDVGELAVLLGA